jgi:hypothetical protein
MSAQRSATCRAEAAVGYSEIVPTKSGFGVDSRRLRPIPLDGEPCTIVPPAITTRVPDTNVGPANDPRTRRSTADRKTSEIVIPVCSAYPETASSSSGGTRTATIGEPFRRGAASTSSPNSTVASSSFKLRVFISLTCPSGTGKFDWEMPRSLSRVARDHRCRAIRSALLAFCLSESGQPSRVRLVRPPCSRSTSATCRRLAEPQRGRLDGEPVLPRCHRRRRAPRRQSLFVPPR